MVNEEIFDLRDVRENGEKFPENYVGFLVCFILIRNLVTMKGNCASFFKKKLQFCSLHP